ncbi:MAG: methylmalonyl-CoA epimerase [Saprospiraceae bacterium]|nr:methylmalonyl-CoA epimerase [Saprospiraceae bacterium]
MSLPIDHIGIAVHDLEAATEKFIKTFDAEEVHSEEVRSQRVLVRFLKHATGTIELLQPTDIESPVYAFLQRRGEGVHHVAFKVDDIHAQHTSMVQRGLNVLHDVPFLGARNKLAFFVHPRDMGGILTELCQPL